MKNGRGKSAGPIVPRKHPNKAGATVPVAEGVEGRGPAKRNSSQQNAHRMQSRASASNALERIRGGARENQGLCTLGQANACASTLEAGAQCEKVARWDLCGGRRAAGAPTATVLVRRETGKE